MTESVMAGTTMQELVQFLLKASNKGVWHHLFSRRRPVASTTSTEYDAVK